MHDKSINNFNDNQQLIHRLPAGQFPGDHRTELIGCRETKAVFVLSNGKTVAFKELNPVKKALIFEKLLQDDAAMNDLKHLSQESALEQFSFCIFGAADSEPDFCESGKLKKAENFICSDNCQCLKWPSKQITIEGQAITSRQLEIIQLMASDLADKQIADKLGITESTLDSHKTKIFEKAGVFSKSGLITKAIDQKIIQ